jgi:hypothetical protein
MYLVSRHPVLLHGSDNGEIEEFEPRRRGFDTNPHGNIMGVYATNDGIWPIFFAILDHSVYRGMMNNGVWYETGESQEVDFPADDCSPTTLGEARKWYWFSLNQEMLPKRPWREGTIYVLPRDTFEQLRFTSGTLVAEWASREPVRPLAKIRVQPEDFPFLDRVHGHDDSEMIALEDGLTEAVQNRLDETELEDGYVLHFEWSEARAEKAFDLLRRIRRLIPVVTVELVAEAAQGPLLLKIRGPETIKNVVKRELDKAPISGVGLGA